MAKFCRGWYKARHLDLKSLIKDPTLRNLWLLSSLAGFTTCNMAIRALNLVLDMIALAQRPWYVNKNVSVKSLFLICINSNLTTIYSPKRFMEDLAVITALNHSGSFGENFVMFKEKR